jgi:3-oxoacyl-[acyl-carrier protein] reductase
MSDLTGKVAIVTGASKGIGAAVAKTLAARGAAVVVNFASSKAGAEAVVKSITGSDGKAIAVQGDVSKAAEAKALVDAAISAYGRLDILVNNSGVYEFGPLESITEPQFRKMFDVNVLGLLLMTQAAAPHLREGASIINIGSGVTAITPPQTAVYTATKGAVDVVTGVLANELGPRKIRVNTVSPSLTETEGTHSAGMLASEFEAGIIAQTPLGRLGQPQDIADVVAFVASDDARWVTGERISAGGGLR